MAFDIKQFLDYPGLQEYDALIKEYIKKETGDSETVEALVNSLAALTAEVAADEQQIEANTQAIAVLNGDADTEGSVAKQVNDAVTALVDGAPEALDTLKEIADWIGTDETGAVALAEKVAKNAQDIEDTKAYVDAQDAALYASITRINDVQIRGLFPVKQSEEQSAAQAIAALEEGEAIQLIENQVVAENLTIDKSCYIDANGATFTGVVTIPADADVIIENATFSNPVVMA